eukprot:SAG25_NODE_2584_length_1514_cov_31.006820_1_plen_104_part_10
MPAPLALETLDTDTELSAEQVEVMDPRLLPGTSGDILSIDDMVSEAKHTQQLASPSASTTGASALYTITFNDGSSQEVRLGGLLSNLPFGQDSHVIPSAQSGQG